MVLIFIQNLQASIDKVMPQLVVCEQQREDPILGLWRNGAFALGWFRFHSHKKLHALPRRWITGWVVWDLGSSRVRSLTFSP